MPRADNGKCRAEMQAVRIFYHKTDGLTLGGWCGVLTAPLKLFTMTC